MRPPLRVYKSNLMHRVSVAIGACMLLLAVVSVGAVVLEAGLGLQRLLIGAWAIAPPSYFFVEYQVLFDNLDDPIATSHLVRLQELASRVWAGVLALLLALHLW